MTKQHFIALADTIRNARASFSDESIRDLAHYCRRMNPAFNESRWLAYIAGQCGPNGGEIK